MASAKHSFQFLLEQYGIDFSECGVSAVESAGVS